MVVHRDQFLFSTEEECLTASPQNPERTGSSIERFLSIGRRQAPSLPGPSGYFNGYGRVYSDIGHIELAAAECDDPYLLTSVVERQHMLASRTVDEMKKGGRRFLLANNNHGGLLQQGCPVWGAHENYATAHNSTSQRRNVSGSKDRRIWKSHCGEDLHDSHVVVYLMSCSPQSTQYLFLSIRALACDCSLHGLAGILSLTTLPQLGQKRTGGFVVRWLKLGHGVMFILIPVG